MELRVYDWQGHLVHIFDKWRSLDYNLKTNDTSDLTASFDYFDGIEDIFKLDNRVQVRRNIGYGWYVEETFLHRTPQIMLGNESNDIFFTYCRCPNDLLDGRWIAYESSDPTPVDITTSKTFKIGSADDVLKQYVRENAGDLALASQGRFRDGVYPNFLVGGNEGLAPLLETTQSRKRLLQVMQELGEGQAVDFKVIYEQTTNQFIFLTYYPQYGSDLTNTLIFRPEFGNVTNLSYTLSRTSEVNVVIATGPVTQVPAPTGPVTFNGKIISVTENNNKNDSPWNDKETMVDATEQQTAQALNDFAQKKLKEAAAQVKWAFTPIEQPNFRYGHDFKLGDKCTVCYRDKVTQQKIVHAHVNFDPAQGEKVELEFGDYKPVDDTIYGAVKNIYTKVEIIEQKPF